MSNRKIYVFGHKNPDTDSIVGAISLAHLQNELGINAVAMTLGSINSETKYALQYFNFKEPKHLNDVKLQIKDVKYHKDCFLNKDLSIKEVIDYLNEKSLTGIPLVESKNKYYGYVSLKEISREIINGDYHKINTSYDNLVKVLNGKKILKFDNEIIGCVNAATFSKETFINNVKLDSSSILIIGDRKSILEYAILNKVKLIIVIANMSLTNELKNIAIENKINIISTPFSSYEVSKIISLSNYINLIIRKEDAITVNEFDYLMDFENTMRNLKHTNYPVIGSKNECKGLLTITDCNDVVKKQVMLVDHNDASQSVEGLEESEILSVIDHHNIGDINTNKPINFNNAATGSVNTIIYDLYKENNIMIPQNIAGLMASAIISDTLLLTSPTTTEKDKNALIELSKIANINYMNYGNDLLKNGMDIEKLSNEQLLYRDFKSYQVNDNLIGIGQILVPDFSIIRSKMDSIVEYLNEEANNKKYKVLTLFVVDIFKKESYVIYNKDSKKIIEDSFRLNNIYEGIELIGVVSRKSQIVPYIMDAIEKL